MKSLQQHFKQYLEAPKIFEQPWLYLEEVNDSWSIHVLGETFDSLQNRFKQSLQAAKIIEQTPVFPQAHEPNSQPRTHAKATSRS